jgi:hypothetical protein
LSTDEVKIKFTTASPSSAPTTHPSLLLKDSFGIVAVTVIAATVAALLMLRKRKKGET